MRPFRSWTLIPTALLGLLGLSAPAPAQVAAQYTLTELQPLAGNTVSAGYSLNATGTVVGWSGTSLVSGSTAGRRAVAWVNGSPTATNLGVLAGDTISEARGINATNTIVGYSSTGGATPADKAVTFTIGGSPTNLNVNSAPSLSGANPALTHSRAEDISPTGEIVGHAYSGDFNNLTAADGLRGFYRNAAGTQVTRLDPTSGTAFYPNDGALSYGINATSQVFGQSIPGGTGTSFLASRWSTPTGNNVTPFTYPTAPGNPALVDYLGFKGNNLNRIVGTAEDDASNPTLGQAFAADATLGTTLLNNLGTGTLGVANAINNALVNVIVGSSTTSGATARHAAAWNWSGTSPTPTAIDLNTRVANLPAGATLVEAFGINDLGQIVGYGDFAGGEHAFLLTPVPEPGSLALVGLAVGGLALRPWRRRKAAR